MRAVWLSVQPWPPRLALRGSVVSGCCWLLPAAPRPAVHAANQTPKPPARPHPHTHTHTHTQTHKYTHGRPHTPGTPVVPRCSLSRLLPAAPSEPPRPPPAHLERHDLLSHVGRDDGVHLGGLNLHARVCWCVCVRQRHARTALVLLPPPAPGPGPGTMRPKCPMCPMCIQERGYNKSRRLRACK